MLFQISYWFIAKVVIVISLIICYTFFVQEVFIKFAAKETNFLAKTKQVEDYQSPTLAFCFDPGMKKSKLDKYNMTDKLTFQILINSSDTIPSMSEIFEESSFQYGKDFKLFFADYLEWNPHELSEGRTKIRMSSSEWMEVELGKIITIPYGLCYHLTSISNLKPKAVYLIGLTLDKDLQDKPNKVGITITSKNNLLGIVRTSWVEGSFVDLSLDLKRPIRAVANLYEYQWHFLSSPPHCDQRLHYECLGIKMLENKHFHNNQCPKICLPLVFLNIKEFVSNETIPLCQTGNENRCMAFMIFDVLREASTQCMKSCHLLEYEEKVKYHPTAWPTSHAEISFKFPDMTSRIHQEYLIYDWIGMIGSIGGSLGLFLGFSFLDVIFLMIDTLQKRFN